MKKRFIALLLCMQMIISLLVPAPVAFAADDEEIREGAQQEATVATSSDAVDSVLTEDGEFAIVTEGEESDAVEGEESDAVEGEESDAVEGEESDAVEGEESDAVEGEESDVVEGEEFDAVEGEESDAVEGEESDAVEGEESEIVEDEETGIIDEEAAAVAEEDEAAALTWVEYEDFVVNEANKAMADHGLYVGYTALFNLDYCQSFYCAAEFDENGTAISSIYKLVGDFADEQGNSYRVKITDYHYEAAYSTLWYKVEALEGETLPEFLQNNPYVAYYDPYSMPALLMQPRMGMFAVETVWIQRQMEPASRYAELNTADLPDFFEVTPMYEAAPADEAPVWDGAYNWYDLGDVTAWAEALAEDPALRYVAEANVVLIPVEVTAAYEKLLGAESPEAYDEIYSTIPESIREQLTDKHIANLEGHREYLEQQAITEYSTSVDFGGVTLPVSVKGKIPKEGVTLIASPVYADQLAAEGFGFSATDLITALDIKILNDDGTEWQPEDGNLLNLTIGVADLGCVEGQIVTLYHKHDGHISKNDLFVVMNGQLDICIPGFSIIAVTEENKTQTVGTAIANGGSATLSIGVPVVYYFQNNNNNGTWIVNDPSGAIHYTVHANVANSASIGNSQVRARWIKIVPLKVTTQDITLTYSTGDATEEYKIRVQAPVAGEGDNGVKLYIKDDVNVHGKIIGTLVNEAGEELSTDGVAFSWSRRIKELPLDDYRNTTIIVPTAYDDGYRSVNIARDYGGLVETRKDANGYLPITYTCVATLVDGSTRTAEYTVYYQSEIINAGFEFPASKERDYSFFPNGYPELYWKTTAPGTGTGNITKDIEYGNVKDLTAGAEGNTNYGVWTGAEILDPRNYDDDPTNNVTGHQFAELNAEEVGALYQDIITVPDEEIEWDFAHAKRPNQSWAPNVQNKMYLVIGATESAQALTNTQLNNLVIQAGNVGSNNADFLACKAPVTVTYQGATYSVWYHNADNQTDYSANGNYGWAIMSGVYTVPANQYRTRVFFVSDPNSNASNKNAGNVIDKAAAGQYKTYMIEYYEQTYEKGVLKTERIDSKQETGEALIYSSQPLKNYNYFLETEHDYLYKIMINGENYPYDIRYSGVPALYIDKYNGTPTDPLATEEVTKDYTGYDIVMQIYLRDTVVAVKKDIVFPAELTEEQKLTIMRDLNQTGGYKASFTMSNTIDETIKDPDTKETYVFNQTGDAVITSRDPKGNYTGYIALGDNPLLGVEYKVTETATSNIPGLKLNKVRFGVQRYSLGQAYDTLIPETYEEYQITAGDVPLECPEFKLEGTIKIADVQVTNTYVEKETTVYYKAIGKGMVRKTTDPEDSYQDMPSETLKFYSGKSVGAIGIAGSGASFVGWFKDEACTQPVTAADGVYDEDAMSFKPNTNIINRDEITFYAKFETAGVRIERYNGEPYQTYVYHIHRNETTEGTTTIPALDLYVRVTCDENGNGFTEVLELVPGVYTVTEISDWSWRYAPDNRTQTQKHADLEKGLMLVYQYRGGPTGNWLNGLSPERKNVKTTQTNNTTP